MSKMFISKREFNGFTEFYVRFRLKDGSIKERYFALQKDDDVSTIEGLFKKLLS